MESQVCSSRLQALLFCLHVTWGTGVHIIMGAKTALELGAPIRGILGFTSTSTCVRPTFVYIH
jgi:hypothetical protein